MFVRNPMCCVFLNQMFFCLKLQDLFENPFFLINNRIVRVQMVVAELS